jgi:hypothetical protein
MNPADDILICSALREIDRLLKQGVLPVHNGHLRDLTAEVSVIELLVHMRRGGLISGDLVTVGGDDSRTPHRLTNIRLTYSGLAMLNKANREVQRTGAV